MTYKALKNCKFDRRYNIGEVIEESVIDSQCLPRAVMFGYIEPVASDSSPEAIKDEETVTHRRGRPRKANGGI